jgi:hypothetical protein
MVTAEMASASERTVGRKRRLHGYLLGAAILVAGLALRLWALHSPLGPLDGDEAVTTLMARHLLHHGQLPAFFWGQEYSGSGEAVLLAGLLALRLPSDLASKLVPIGLSALAAYLVWRLGRRTVGETAAIVGAALWWLAPAAFVWASVKERGSYELTVVLGIALLLLVLQAADQAADQAEEQPSWKRAAAIGLVASVGWWTNPQIAYMAVPGLGWLVYDQIRKRSNALVHLGPVAAAGALLGAAPWILRNLRTGFASLSVPPTLPQTTFPHRLGLFWHFGLPMALGFRIPIHLLWVGNSMGKGLTLVTVLAVAVAIVTARGPRVLLAAVALSYPLLYAAFPTSFYYGEPRYLYVLSPVLALLAARSVIGATEVLTRRRVWALAAVGTAVVLAPGALAVYGLHDMGSIKRTPDQALHDLNPAPLGPALRALRSQGITRIWGDYWLVQRITAETNEQIIGAPGQVVRYRPYELAVRSARRAAYVVMAGSCYDTQIGISFIRRGVAFQEIRAGELSVILPAVNVPAEQALTDWAAPRGLPGASVC